MFGWRSNWKQPPLANVAAEIKRDMVPSLDEYVKLRERAERAELDLKLAQDKLYIAVFALQKIYRCKLPGQKLMRAYATAALQKLEQLTE